MINRLDLGVIRVSNVYLWAHVGVLAKEQTLGQSFLVSFSLWLDMNEAAKHDDLSSTADYSIAIKKMQELALQTKCLTIEKFSENILDLLERLYGQLPIKVVVRKCHPPVEGFNGSVEIERTRNFTA